MYLCSGTPMQGYRYIGVFLCRSIPIYGYPYIGILLCSDTALYRDTPLGNLLFLRAETMFAVLQYVSRIAARWKNTGNF